MSELPFPVLKGCPWDGKQPKPTTWRVRNAGEPYRMVALRCACGAERAMALNDDNVGLMEEVNYWVAKRKLPYENACMVVGVFKLAEVWNRRV